MHRDEMRKSRWGVGPGWGTRGPSNKPERTIPPSPNGTTDPLGGGFSNSKLGSITQKKNYIKTNDLKYIFWFVKKICAKNFPPR